MEGIRFTVLRRCAAGSSRLFSFRAQDERTIKGPSCPKKVITSSRVKVAKGITSWLAHPRIAHSGMRLSNNWYKTQQSSCIDPYCFSRTSPMPFRFIKKTFHLTNQFLPNQIKPLKTSSAYNSFLTISPGANHPPLSPSLGSLSPLQRPLCIVRRLGRREKNPLPIVPRAFPIFSLLSFLSEHPARDSAEKRA